jgi:isoleucyl-tRNA synthetase
MKGGNKAVIESLQNKGNLLFSEKIVHKYPYDWRSLEPIIIR